NCFQCQKCENTNGDTCSGELETCDTSVDSCLTTLVVTIHGGEKCVTKETINCTGAQTKCFSYTGGIYIKGKFVDTDLKGCTTEDVCTHHAPTYPATLLKDGYILTCP
ncbi:Hypothetical predicted protein, partial [Pelobates cultripes]